MAAHPSSAGGFSFNSEDDQQRIPLPEPGETAHSQFGPPPAGSMDSITLGQLRTIVNSAPKPKQSFYDFRYEDEDTLLNEIQEFFSYVEMPQVAENLKSWEGCFQADWTQSRAELRRKHVVKLLDGLEHRDTEIRFTNARRLFYILQGTFAESTSPEHQLHWIIENCKLVRAVDGLNSIVDALKIAGSKHDLLCSISDIDTQRFNISVAEKQELIEEANTELSVYLGMLYLIVETCKEHDDFADELMSLDPPLPVYLFETVSGMRDKSAKGYPVKKLLLVLWKTILAVCGGMRELVRVKRLSREVAGLPDDPEEGASIKSTPLDMHIFRQETSTKYPTFVGIAEPVPTRHSNVDSNVLSEKLAEAYAPIKVRHHYSHHEDLLDQPQNGSHQVPFPQSQQPPQYRPTPVPQSLTPAPSPPPSPKPKKQQYQTDQTKPFVLPFARKRPGQNARLVPFAIDEATRLYSQHMYVSVSLWQLWKTREECVTEESGLKTEVPRTSETGDWSKPTQEGWAKEEETETLADVKMLQSLLRKVEEDLRMADTPGDRVETRRLKERREDVQRLLRIETIYRAGLPVLPNWVLVLLKLLLATVAASSANQPPLSATSPHFGNGVTTPSEQQPPPPPMTLDDIDVLRHREVTSKAVSAILLLTLKWFKVSHVMKFHHLGQSLLDSNCLLLILKLFGLVEVAHTVVSKADSPNHNFFRYCQLHFSRNREQSRPEDAMLGPPARQTIIRPIYNPNGTKGEEEIELVSEFSWRNFFASINFVKIMQKLSKHHSHRIWLLVQYKSSAILKRILRVSHPVLQLHVLKLIKSQVPFCGRKWRQSNMKVITSIYMQCRPDLRDEWLTGFEVDDVGEAYSREQALIKLVKYYNTKRYGLLASQGHVQSHKRTSSLSGPLMDGFQHMPELAGMLRPQGGTPNYDRDVFPPVRSQAPDPSIFLPYVTEDIAFEEEYEEYLSDLGMLEDASDGSGKVVEGEDSAGRITAWYSLPKAVADITDGISDSESIISIGDLGEEVRPEDADGRDENRNDWAHLSPKTMAALPKSPGGHRRSSSGGQGLRPVLPFGLDDGSALELTGEEEEEELVGPAPREAESSPFGGGVDEVEYLYNE